jgi:uncharacterized membrane protein YedE/YeeE
MIRLFIALGAGLLFGAGLGVSQMVDPAKVLGFLDIAGRWDPSLALVMGGALLVTLPLTLPILKRGQPFFAQAFDLPSKTRIDPRLAGGASLFGIGWGLVGFCPGPAISSIAYLRGESGIFLLAMLAGAALFTLMPSPGSPKAAPA